MKMKLHPEFIKGVAVSLDVVATFGEGTIFKEILLTTGSAINDVLLEIKKNGLPQTKRLAEFEFPELWSEVSKKKCW